jgi:uroporphyrin-III C-methyltransferase/precorrin-2 dehydrogenase/sirohydrochlorin ferrochelatase
MRYLPIHVDLKHSKVLIVGGGAAAEAKLRTLVKTDAELIIVSATISPEISRWVENEQIEWKPRAFEPNDLSGVRLVYAATEDKAHNTEIAQRATNQGLLVNVADQKDDCSFITPALVDRSPVTISIGTEGTSPGLARAIKADLEARLPSTLGRLASFIQSARKQVAKRIPDLAGRQRFWADIFGANDLTTQLRLSEDALANAINLKMSGENESGGGLVSLVGAGPGNPDYLTHQARQKLHSADVIVYDRLVSQGVLDFGRREAEYIYVGKIPGGKSTPQDEINDTLVAKAKLGLSVVRLKSGDPLIFGRADEEIEVLDAENIPFEICPGITSAAAAAAAIGASLTSRGHNKSVSLITGHDAKGFAEHDWTSLAQPGARAAVYMGVGAARFIQGRLMLYGAANDLPIAIVENASRPEQVIIASRLDRLPDDLAAANVKGPAILMIGYAVKDALPMSALKSGIAS